MSDPRSPGQRSPAPATRRQPWWVETAAWVGGMWVIIIFISGSADWSRDLAAQLSAWGIPGGDKNRIGNVSFLPVLAGMLGFWRPLNRAACDAAIRLFAVGILWGAAFFLSDPAARILFHFAAPGFAATENATLVRIGLDVLLTSSWLYLVLMRQALAQRRARSGPRPDEGPQP